MGVAVHASVQVAEGLAKRTLFPCSCGLTGGNKSKRTDCHFTSLHNKSPSLHTRSRRERREYSAHHHHNHKCQTLRRTPLGEGRRGEEEGGKMGGVEGGKWRRETDRCQKRSDRKKERGSPPLR